ncbi:MAG: CPBP family intramembrane glutamic endopeptidase [Candidatus Bathyarchaeia archaeon]
MKKFAKLVYSILLSSLISFNKEGLAIVSQRMNELVLDFFILFSFTIPINLSKGTLFFIIQAIFIVCFIVAWKEKEDFTKTLKNGFFGSMNTLFKNYLYAMPLIACMLLTLITLLHSIQETHGIPTGSIVIQNQFEALLDLAYSSIREEISFRITPIGTLLALYFIFEKSDRFPKKSFQKLKLLTLTFLNPLKAKSKLGIFERITSIEWFSIIFTSIIFGIAHFISGVGWEIGKVSSATIAGIALGIVYVIYGAYASILIHWFFNYYLTVYEIAIDLYPGSFKFLIDLINSISMILGVIGWANLAFCKLYRFLKRFL